MNTSLEIAYWDSSIGAPGDGESFADVYDKAIARAKKVEQLGWTSYFVIEHQNRPTDSVTSPSVFLAALARETTTLRLGAMMWQLPFYHPIRLAQEIAMLDQLSHGRIEFGTGIGVHEHEFIRWNVPYYERAKISEEVMQVVRLAWSGDAVTFQGKYFTFEEAIPTPVPLQQPHPRIWTAGHSEASMVFAATNGYAIAKNGDTDEVVRQRFDTYREAWRAAGHDRPIPGIFLQRQVFVAKTDAEAHEQARRYLVTGKSRFESSPITNTRIGWGSDKRGMGTDGHRADSKVRGETIARAAVDYDFNIESGLAIVGSPKTVAERILQGAERLGYTTFCGGFEFGGMPADVVASSIDLFGREVVPVLRSASVSVPV